MKLSHPSTIPYNGGVRTALLYAAYYQGQDYYNIWYDRFISVLEIGISADLSASIDR